MDEDLLYKIALTLIPGVGPMTARKLLAVAGSPEAIFQEPLHLFNHSHRKRKALFTEQHRTEALQNARKEIEFIQKNRIRVIFYLDPEYPGRLKQCEDAPVLLYFQGDEDLDPSPERIISIVGTRNSTPYGEGLCEKLVAQLAVKYPGLIIVSGLAYGIDICAHRAALKHGLKTIAVLGHGLQLIYPALHRKTAGQIVAQGGLMTEFGTTQTPDKRNFVQRNRIIAGLSDATVVIESGNEGGALITAELANSYNRDVFAFPGRVGDRWSAGCHKLIRTNQAALIESSEDLEYFLGWKSRKEKPVQKNLFPELTHEEEELLNLLKEGEELSVDEISRRSGQPVSRVSSILLNLEFNGLVKSLPGNIVRYVP